jgi:hypothetical protein
MVVAIIALVMAMGGTTYALTLPANSVGPIQLRPSAVLNSKIQLRGVSNSRLGTNAVTFSKLANGQFTSQKIRDRSLLVQDLAANAITRYALVATDASIPAQSGGISIASQTAGTTVLNFGASVAGRPILVSLAGSGNGQLAAAPCGGPSPANPGGVVCPTAVNSPSFVSVDTNNSSGSAAARPFYIAVPLA